jgi:excisionase family DNA binding protein
MSAIFFAWKEESRMAIAEARENLVAPDPAEAKPLTALREQINEIYREHGEARLVGPNGEMLGIPASAFHALQLLVEAMARGQTITLVPHGEELTTQQAADLLRVSRPHLVKLLEEGEIPFHRVGTHRRIRIEDVLAYRNQSSKERRAKLDELTRLSEEFEGGYR